MRVTAGPAVRWGAALGLGAVWWWAVLRLVLSNDAGVLEGAVAAGGWGLSVLPVHCVPRGGATGVLTECRGRAANAGRAAGAGACGGGTGEGGGAVAFDGNVTGKAPSGTAGGPPTADPGGSPFGGFGGWPYGRGGGAPSVDGDDDRPFATGEPPPRRPDGESGLS